MRLWSIHPKYLDQRGLCGLWREALQAQRVLLQGEYRECGVCEGRKINPLTEKLCSDCRGTGKIKTPYWNHPQLERFKNIPSNIGTLALYLWEIYYEGRRRGYDFDDRKINPTKVNPIMKQLTVTKGQLEYEFEHLQRKLYIRNRKMFLYNNSRVIPCGGEELYGELLKYNFNETMLEPHPLFKVVEGGIESWERLKK